MKIILTETLNPDGTSTWTLQNEPEQPKKGDAQTITISATELITLAEFFKHEYISYTDLKAHSIRKAQDSYSMDAFQLYTIFNTRAEAYKEAYQRLVHTMKKLGISMPDDKKDENVSR